MYYWSPAHLAKVKKRLSRFNQYEAPHSTVPNTIEPVEICPPAPLGGYVYLVGCWSRLVLVGAVGFPSIDDQHELATEDIKAFDRSFRPIREWSAPPAVLLEQPLEVLPCGHQECL